MTPAEFRAARKLLNWTQAEAAPRLGYVGKRGVQTISEIERGQAVPPAAALLMRFYLIVAPDAWPAIDTPRRLPQSAARP